MLMNIKAILLRPKSARFPKGRFWRNLGLNDKDKFGVIDKSTNEVIWEKGKYQEY